MATPGRLVLVSHLRSRRCKYLDGRLQIPRRAVANTSTGRSAHPPIMLTRPLLNNSFGLYTVNVPNVWKVPLRKPEPLSR